MARPYKDDDDGPIMLMLASEGVEPHRMLHRECVTYCFDMDDRLIGFFTLAQEQGFPSLKHFYVHPDYRDGKVSRGMMRVVKKLTGGNRLIVHARKGSEWLKRIIEGYFGTAPYAETHDKFWYIVEVKR